MFERISHSNGLITWQSSLLRALHVPHAFSTRHGGISSAPFDSLNLGNPSTSDTQDPHDHLLENYRRLQHVIGIPHMPRAWVRQVHGRSVELLEREPENEYAESLDAELRDRFSGQLAADALVSAVPNVLLTIRVADCVPILFASHDGLLVASAHAGWRGVVGNIVAKTLRTLHEAGAAPPRITAAVGPCISAEHFEVGEEVAVEFANHGLADAIRPVPNQKPHIDLQHAVRTQLQQAGVTAIDTHPFCTFRDAADFYSHRRDHGTTGRMAAVIAPAQ
jgi:YfiH family protein